MPRNRWSVRECVSEDERKHRIGVDEQRSFNVLETLVLYRQNVTQSCRRARHPVDPQWEGGEGFKAAYSTSSLTLELISRYETRKDLAN